MENLSIANWIIATCLHDIGNDSANALQALAYLPSLSH
ncbi:hypothetical protein CSIRO_2772 [Bradyrhizobiaceae bacterium SG-6C]|nr:hypothetical protein CSIRO_2772 [Bradyrhizobiaceae bacterium SG-6C]